MWFRYLSSSSPPCSLVHIPLQLLIVFLSLHQITARVLQLHNPHNITHDNLTVESVVQTALDHLHHSSDPMYYNFGLRQISLGATHCFKLRPSSNISDFHAISLFGTLGNPAGTPLGAPYLFENKYPEQWGQWNYTNHFKLGALTLDHSSPPSPAQAQKMWRLAQHKMPVEKADRLLKNAGFWGPYRDVELAFDTAPWAPFSWLFRWIDVPGKPSNDTHYNFVTVEVETERVTFFGWKESEALESWKGGLSLEALGSGSDASCMTETS